MRLYRGMSREFVLETVRNQIATTLSDAFFSYFRYRPGPAEVTSWRHSLRAMAQVVQHAELNDHGVLLEYQLPLSSRRLDCMFCGRNEQKADQAVVVELKQWEASSESDADNLVMTWVGGRKREVLHPSVQVGQYQEYLLDCHTAFYDGDAPIGLKACSYLHNYSPEPDDAILAPKFREKLAAYPLFGGGDVDSLAGFLQEHLARGEGDKVLDRVEGGTCRPSRKLMDHVAETIDHQSPWVLLDEQLVVYEKILALVRKGLKKKQKYAVVIRGGPGTGKSVIAINLLGELLRRGINAHYATGSKAFTETLWSLLGNRSRAMLKYFNSYSQAEDGAVEVLVCDEAHRIRETSNNRFTKKEHRRTTPQLHEILAASHVSVFLLDDRQVVRPNEIGSSAYILDEAKKLGCEVADYQLEVQFRCAGSDAFVNWINNTLGVEKTANVLWDGAEGFDFRIVPSVEELDELVREKANEGHSARIAAGFCWPWSPPREDGTLVDDVVIGEFRRPWDAKPGNWKLAPGIPSASLWATDPNGLDQVGCVYNIQGFELDYVGVVWGPDLRYDFDQQAWIGDKKKSCDNVQKRSKEQFVNLVKNTYRVLLSRGIKGCFVYFMDKDTERFVRSRIEAPSVVEVAKVAEKVPPGYSGSR